MSEDDDDLFGEAWARRSDPDTSHEAAESVRHESANHHERLVYAALWDHGAMTTHELVARIGLPWNTISPRIKPLRRKGFVVDTGLRRVGPAGKRCIVWDIKRDALEGTHAVPDLASPIPASPHQASPCRALPSQAAAHPATQNLAIPD